MFTVSGPILMETKTAAYCIYNTILEQSLQAYNSTLKH